MGSDSYLLLQSLLFSDLRLPWFFEHARVCWGSASVSALRDEREAERQDVILNGEEKGEG
jgi:hypothetical protein